MRCAWAGAKALYIADQFLAAWEAAIDAGFHDIRAMVGVAGRGRMWELMRRLMTGEGLDSHLGKVHAAALLDTVCKSISAVPLSQGRQRSWPTAVQQISDCMSVLGQLLLIE